MTAERKTSPKPKATRKTPKPGRKRYRRSEDELIADLQKKIEDLEVRKETRKLKTEPGFKVAIAADRALVRAEEQCREAGHVKLANSLKAAHIALQPHLDAEAVAAE